MGANVPTQLKREVAKAVEDGKFLNESDLIRQALRKILEV